MKSAVDARQRPIAALLEEPDPYSNWTSHDYRVQEAIHTIDREVCKSCGNPVWLCHSYDNRIQFDVRVGACYAKAEIEDIEKENERSGVDSLKPGEYRYAVPIGIENGKDKNGKKTYDPLPSRSEALEKMV